MTFVEWVGLGVAFFVMLVGTAGSLLPGIPSTPLVLATAVVHRFCFGDTGPGNLAILILVLITVFSLALDYLATTYGAKKCGASWKGATGAVIGVMIGMFFGLPGIILGPFLFALLFEWAGGREWRKAAKAGGGAVLGLFAGALGKTACCVAMMGVFTFSVVWRAANTLR